MVFVTNRGVRCVDTESIEYLTHREENELDSQTVARRTPAGNLGSLQDCRGANAATERRGVVLRGAETTDLE